jgi:hypothetical protein
VGRSTTPSQQPRRRSKEQLRKEAEEKFAQEHPFRPRLSANNGSAVGSGTGVAGVGVSGAHGTQGTHGTHGTHGKLYEDRRAEWAAREAKKRMIEEEKEEEERAKRVDRRVPQEQASSSSRRAAERLYREAEARRERLTRLEKERVEREMAEHPFRPALNPTSAAILEAEGGDAAHVPLHERIEDVQRTREENVHRRRLETLAADEDLTFHPTVNPLSERLAVSRGRTVMERLQAGARDVEQRRAAATRQVEEEKEQRCTFQPAINERSREMIADHPRLSEGFFSRLRETAEARDRHLDVLRRETDEQRLCTFQPETTAAAAAHDDADVAHDTKARTDEGLSARFERLNRDADRVVQKQEALREAYYGQFDFRPRIDAISRRIGRSRTAEEHHRNAEGEAKRRALELEKQRAFEEEHTFRPSLVDKPDRILAATRTNPFRLAVGQEGLADRLRALQEARDQRIAQARRANEYEQLKDCPFQPEVKPAPPPPPPAPVLVRGLARHLELRSLAARQEHDRAEREREAFRVKPAARAANAPGSPTVPKPFRLASDARAQDPKVLARRAREQAEAQQAALGECTFRPNTLEAQRKAAIDALIAHAE